MRRASKSPLKIQIDGAARGNPGPAGVGVVLTEGRRRLKEISLYLGPTTNNVAESCALIVALQEAVRLGFQRVQVLTDSQLLARQVTGDYRVKNPQLQWLHALIGQLLGGLREFQIQHVPREQNRQADRLANRAVDDGVRREGKPRRRAPASQASSGPAQPSLFGDLGEVV